MHSPERRASKRRAPSRAGVRAFDHVRRPGIRSEDPQGRNDRMFERFKRGSEDPSRSTAPAGEERVANGRTAVAERPTTTTAGTGRGATRTRDEATIGRDEPATRPHVPAGTAGGGAVGTREHMH